MISDCLPKPLSFDGLHGTELAKVWQDVIGEDSTFDAFLSDDCDPAASAGTTITVDGKSDTLLHLLKQFQKSAFNFK